MKTIIAGSRDFCNRAELWNVINTFDEGVPITEVVSGGCRGVDQLGEEWAKQHGIPLKRFPADWTAHGKAAGPIRNREMAAYADALIAIWDGESRGTKNMIDEAKKRGLLIHIHQPKKVDTEDADLFRAAIRNEHRVARDLGL